jgi:hypothetical protein
MCGASRATNDSTVRFQHRAFRLLDRPHVQLHHVLRHAPHVFTPERLNASSRGVATLEQLLPSRFQATPVVYLSHNALRSLRGAGQFYVVRTLSLAGNALADFGELYYLAPCTQLQHLSLQGNPLASRPFYRSRVLCAAAHCGLTRLSSLDGEAIDSQEWGVAAACLQRHARALSLLLSQECRIHQLALLARLLPLHRELLALRAGVAVPWSGSWAEAKPCLRLLARGAAQASSAFSPFGSGSFRLDLLLGCVTGVAAAAPAPVLIAG